MILKDGQRFNIGDNKEHPLVKQFLEEFPHYKANSTLHLKYVQDLIKWDSVNQMNIWPNMRALPTTILIDSDLGPTEWIYCDNFKKRQDGSIENVYPPVIEFRVTMNIPRIKLEKAFFMWIHPQCANGVNSHLSVNHIYVFENKGKEADEKMAIFELKNWVETMITNTELGLPIERIQAIAPTYAINPESMEDKVLRVALMEAIHKLSAKQGIKTYQEFKLLIVDKSKEQTINRNQIIVAAKQLGLLELKGIKIEAGGFNHAWAVKDRGGEILYHIGKHKKNVDDPNEQLIRGLEEDQEAYLYLVDQCQGEMSLADVEKQ